MKVNTWEAVENILFDGTTEDIKDVRCPECDQAIFYTYNPVFKSLEYGCKTCGKHIRAKGCHEEPNCYKHLN